MKRRTFWLLYVVFLFAMLFSMARCTSAKAENTPTNQVKADTFHVHTESITGFYVKTTSKGTETYQMIYDDADQGIDDIIPVPKNVYEYIMTCSAMKIAPHLGIVYKNNRHTKVVKYNRRGYKPQKLGKITIYKKKT